MQFVFGIDVSCDSVTVAVASDEHTLLREYKINSDKAGFSRLLKDLRSVNHPQIIYESTGVYSRRVRTFLIHQGYDFVELNPLQAKLDLTENFRRKKTDRNDARDLACSQYIRNRLTTVQEKPVCLDLRDNERFYQQLTRDDVRKEDQLERVIQVVFPGVQRIYSDKYGQNLYETLQLFPNPDLVLKESLDSLTNKLQAGLSKRLGKKRCRDYAQRLINAAKAAYPAVDSSSCMLHQMQFYCQSLLEIEQERDQIINQMVAEAKAAKLPELEIYQSVPGIGLTTAICLTAELGDLHRFSSPSKINAYIGIDLVVYESGNYTGHRRITKHGNQYARKILFRTIDNILAATKTHPCHIADYYRRRKKESSKSPEKVTKKIHIAAMARLLRTIYHLVLHNQKYNYEIAISH
ncbi:IS110 family RNA-guided transposase [Lactiplantibacillus pentosus]|uniref:IS110 family transposase n=2 Tax=Lactiplantibacillus pentosus TaxID=1589 RepID=A0AB37RK24_LACPE|nr:IS110 family transposase [Lactiplantibacillus pentosus]RMW43821.1 IS110 family transposase [Lactiplantibacillus pentosus]RMW45636.1 IS110 family transposase [Lactiplantibacillus pentosus]RMW52110.1 IS110 family transposase [Lactiplantibacillus pentosus]RMW54615.1 IS110 family transposase [Lactiplantibacillus pentosus]